MIGMWPAIVVFAVVIVLAWVAYRYGRSVERRTAAERTAEDAAHDVEVAGRPFVDNPFGRMQPKG